MTVNLMAANRQWANRPPDERFWTIDDLARKLTNVKAAAREGNALIGRLKVEAVGEDIVVSGDNNSARITNHAFGQLCGRVDFPASPMQKLSANLAADVLNYRIQKIAEEFPETEVQLLLDMGEDVTIRSVTSDKYARVFGADFIPFLRKMQFYGWKVPPARPNGSDTVNVRYATEADILANNEFAGGGLSVKLGDPIAPAGLYAGDRDMFVFMVNTDQQVDDGTGRKWSRGFFLSNSEVGAASVSLTEFMMANVCGNHIVWDATNIAQIKYRHIGEAMEKTMGALAIAERRLSDWQPRNLGDRLKLLRESIIGPDKDDVVDVVYKMRLDPALTQKALCASYDAAEVYGVYDGADANSPLGLVHGMTRHSQTLTNANERMKLDQAAGKILDKFGTLLTQGE